MKITEVRELENDELRSTLNNQKHALMRLRFSAATRQATDTSELGKVRKTIARINTVIREREILAQLNAESSAASSVTVTPVKATSADPKDSAQSAGNVAAEKPDTTAIEDTLENSDEVLSTEEAESVAAEKPDATTIEDTLENSDEVLSTEENK